MPQRIPPKGIREYPPIRGRRGERTACLNFSLTLNRLTESAFSAHLRKTTEMRRASAYDGFGCNRHHSAYGQEGPLADSACRGGRRAIGCAAEGVARSCVPSFRRKAPP